MANQPESLQPFILPEKNSFAVDNGTTSAEPETIQSVENTSHASTVTTVYTTKKADELFNALMGNHYHELAFPVYRLSREAGLCDPDLPGNTPQNGYGTLEQFRNNNICDDKFLHLYRDFCHQNLTMTAACARAIHDGTYSAKEIVEASAGKNDLSSLEVLNSVRKNHPGFGQIGPG